MASRLILLTDGLDGQDGGIQRVSRSVVATVQGDEIATLIWSSNDQDSSARRKEGAPVEIRCFGDRHKAMALAAVTTRAIPRDCRKIICWHLHLAPVAAILAWRSRCPFVVYLHGVEAWTILPFYLRHALRKTESFGANSRYTLERFRSTHPGLAHKPGMVVPLGLNREFVEASGGRADIRSSPYFLTVTRLDEEYKGVGTVLEAFKRFESVHPGHSLVCVGEGPARGQLQDRAASLGLGRTVQFLGRVSDAELAARYAESLGFILLSEGEGFGIAFLEAMYHGKPCVAANADASREIVEDGVTGLLVPPRDPAGAAAAMGRLAEEPELCRRLGEEGRCHVLARFMPEHFRDRLRSFMAV